MKALDMSSGRKRISLLHTKIRDGASKAKIERQFRTLKETWLYTLDLDSITTLAQFNRLLKDYMRTYNTSVHSGIGTTPMERFLSRMPGLRADFRSCFFTKRWTAQTLTVAGMKASSTRCRWICVEFSRGKASLRR